MTYKLFLSRFIRKHSLYILAPLAFALLLSSCGGSASNDETRLDTDADFIGFITEIHSIGNKGTLGQILVESHADKLVDKYVITLKDETMIFTQKGEQYNEAVFQGLKTKQWVQIWFSGPIAESFPMQGTAQQVVITDQPVEINDSPEPAPVPPPPPTGKPVSYSEPPAITIDTSKQYTATIETAKGNLVLELFASDVPVTVNNFVFLSREGFYDGTTFHRVITDFMAQGGDPTGTGYGGPGYEFADEFSDHTHVTGALSMANGGPNTNGSQFFITYAPKHHLDNHHSVFGQLTDGMDVLKALENGDAIVRITIEER